MDYFHVEKKTLLLEEQDLVGLVTSVGLDFFIEELIKRIETGFLEFAKGNITVPARHEFFFKKGTVESMPCADDRFFAVKLINTHPLNSRNFNLPTIIGCGALIDGQNGFPVLLTESTLLTALRTAAASAVATKHLYYKNCESFGIIGAGAQSIPQTHAISKVCGFSKVYISDLNPLACAQYKKSAQKLGFDAEILDSKSLCEKSDLIVSATCKARDGKPIILDNWICSGKHINAVGGDSPGKFELDKNLLLRSKVVVDFYPQALIEGESQQLSKEQTYGHLGEIISGAKKGRKDQKEITIFDSTGFAMEDLATYMLVYELSRKLGTGKEIDIVGNPKNNFDLYESYFLS
ncbi:MAG: ornithine cyclodeaminase [Candidatus Micrarchaeia archaeon]